MPIDIFDQQYWRELRKRTYVSKTGYAMCSIWAERALELLLEDGVTGFASVVAAARQSNFRHQFLAKRLDSRTVFVADGTVGQIDANYLNGYYSLPAKAPDSFKWLYSKIEQVL